MAGEMNFVLILISVERRTCMLLPVLIFTFRILCIKITVLCRSDEGEIKQIMLCANLGSKGLVS